MPAICVPAICERDGCENPQVSAFKPGCSHGCRVSIGKARARAEREGLAEKPTFAEKHGPVPAGHIGVMQEDGKVAHVPADEYFAQRKENAAALVPVEDANASRVAEIVKHLSIVARLMGVPCELRVIINADGRVELPPFRAGGSSS